MLSAQFIRDNLDRVRRDMAARGADAPIDAILALDERRRALIGEVEGLRAERNAASKAIGQTKDADERAERIAAARALGERLDGLEAQLREAEASLTDALYEVPNVLDPETPPGADDRENVTLRTVGEPRAFGFEPKPHWEVGETLGGIDLARGAKMAGSRFFVLRGGVARLHRAMIQWMVDFHAAGGYVEHYLPYMLTEESFYASGHLPDFRDNLYRDAEQDYLFVPTAEAPFANLYRDEILPPGSLPQRLVAHTPCFRREKMSAGRDTRGLKRLHQFEKVELFVFCEPDESEAELQAMVERACALAEALEIPLPRAPALLRRHRLQGLEGVRRRALVAGRGGVAGGELRVGHARLPGAAGERALPPRGGRAPALPPPAQRLRAGRAARPHRHHRELPAGRRLHRRPRRAPALHGRPRAHRGGGSGIKAARVRHAVRPARRAYRAAMRLIRAPAASPWRPPW